MNYFRVINFQRKHRIRYSLALITFAFITIFAYYGSSYIFGAHIKPTALIKGNPDEKQVAFTFNISWGDEKVHDIIKVLDKHDVRATFFVSGEWAERHPQVLEAVTEQEHELGMLGYRYKNYLEQEISQVRKDIVYAKTLFDKLGYRQIRYIRPPSGLFNEEIITLSENLGLEVVHWSIASNDWENPGVEAIVKESKKATNGDIILFHASDVAKQTASALEHIINDFKKRNFTFVTISQLKDGVTSDESIVE